MVTFFKRDFPSRIRTKAEAKRAAEANWRKVCREVTKRDGGYCRVCLRRCTSSGPMKGHHHHLVFRSAGGADSVANTILACAICHDEIHRHETQVDALTKRGADGSLKIRRRDWKGV